MVKCWGFNGNGGDNTVAGFLGTGDNVDHDTATTVTALNSVMTNRQNSLLSLATSNRHICALTTAGAVYCWGDNTNGQSRLLASTTSIVIPNYISKTGGGNFTNATEVSVVAYHSCAKNNVGITCWGSAANGLLGTGPTAVRTYLADTPIALSQGVSAEFVSSGESHSCAYFGPITGVQCWGLNNVGQIGIGFTNTGNVLTQSDVPMRAL